LRRNILDSLLLQTFEDAHKFLTGDLIGSRGLGIGAILDTITQLYGKSAATSDLFFEVEAWFLPGLRRRERGRIIGFVALHRQ
jgi:hypothetical protein